jgi:F0F1-type ATP synthase delta subunit
LDYLNEIGTLYERDLLISEIESYKRKDMSSIRQSFLDLIPIVDIDSLYKNLKKIEIVRVTLAIEPSTGISNLINDFFKTNYSKKVIFDYEVDKEILGGIKIIFKGNYYDFSI